MKKAKLFKKSKSVLSMVIVFQLILSMLVFAPLNVRAAQTSTTVVSFSNKTDASFLWYGAGSFELISDPTYGKLLTKKVPIQQGVFQAPLEATTDFSNATYLEFYYKDIPVDGQGTYTNFQLYTVGNSGWLGGWNPQIQIKAIGASSFNASDYWFAKGFEGYVRIDLSTHRQSGVSSIQLNISGDGVGKCSIGDIKMVTVTQPTINDSPSLTGNEINIEMVNDYEYAVGTNLVNSNTPMGLWGLWGSAATATASTNYATNGDTSMMIKSSTATGIAGWPNSMRGSFSNTNWGDKRYYITHIAIPQQDTAITDGILRFSMTLYGSNGTFSSPTGNYYVKADGASSWTKMTDIPGYFYLTYGFSGYVRFDLKDFYKDGNSSSMQLKGNAGSMYFFDTWLSSLGGKDSTALYFDEAYVCDFDTDLKPSAEITDGDEEAMLLYNSSMPLVANSPVKTTVQKESDGIKVSVVNNEANDAEARIKLSNASQAFRDPAKSIRFSAKTTSEIANIGFAWYEGNKAVQYLASGKISLIDRLSGKITYVSSSAGEYTVPANFDGYIEVLFSCFNGSKNFRDDKFLALGSFHQNTELGILFKDTIQDLEKNIVVDNISVIYNTPYNEIWGINIGATTATYLNGVTLNAGEEIKITDELGNPYNGKLKTGLKVIKTNEFGKVVKESKIMIKGDVDCSGSITISDLLSLKKSLIGISKLSKVQASAANINSDLSLNVNDLASLKRALLKTENIVQPSENSISMVDGVTYSKALDSISGVDSAILNTNPDRGLRLENYLMASTGWALSSWGGSLSAAGLLEDMLADYDSESPQLAQTHINLLEYYNKDLDAKALKNIKTYFNLLRVKKIKTVLSFAYETDENGTVGPNTAQILKHISQIAPIVEEYKDVIHAWQAGFVGLWGEWHDSVNVLDEKAILEAVIDAAPTGMFVQVRNERVKQLLDANDSARRSKLGYADLYVTNYLHLWSSCWISSGVPVAPGYNEASKYSLNDGEMPWGADPRTEIPENDRGYIDPFNVAKRMQLHSFTSFSLYHNYREAGAGQPTYDMELWKTVEATPANLSLNGLRYDEQWFKDANGNTISRNMFEYISEYLGYRIKATAFSATKNGSNLTVLVDLKNDGFAAPLGLSNIDIVMLDLNNNIISTDKACDLSELYGGALVYSGADFTNVTSAFKIGIRLKNSEGTCARLANDAEFVNGVNILATFR